MLENQQDTKKIDYIIYLTGVEMMGSYLGRYEYQGYGWKKYYIFFCPYLS